MVHFGVAVQIVREGYGYSVANSVVYDADIHAHGNFLTLSSHVHYHVYLIAQNIVVLVDDAGTGHLADGVAAGIAYQLIHTFQSITQVLVHLVLCNGVVEDIVAVFIFGHLQLVHEVTGSGSVHGSLTGNLRILKRSLYLGAGAVIHIQIAVLEVLFDYNFLTQDAGVHHHSHLRLSVRDLLDLHISRHLHAQSHAAHIHVHGDLHIAIQRIQRHALDQSLVIDLFGSLCGFLAASGQ